jgi:hypothetical protein
MTLIKPNEDEQRWPFVTLCLMLVLLAFILCYNPAHGGEANIAWDEVTHPDLVGYNVYVGQQTGDYTIAPVCSNSPGPCIDAQTCDGTVCNARILNLGDCTDHYFAVKAKDVDDNTSLLYSNELVGWAQPGGTNLVDIEQGSSVSTVLSGWNLKTGSVVNAFRNFGTDNEEIVSDITFVSSGDGCATIDVTITAHRNAVPEVLTIAATHPVNRVYGAIGTLNVLPVGDLPNVPNLRWCCTN